MANHIKFTKSVIDSIPLSLDKQVFYRDIVTIGFGLCVGQTKSYFAEKKMPNGKSKRKTIGKHGVYTLEQARTEAKRLLILMDEGIDPVQQKRQIKVDYEADVELTKKIPTIAESYEFYKTRKALKSTSISAYDMCVNDYYADWKDLKITQITETMVINRHIELTKRSPAQANLAAKFLRALFNHTELRYKDENGQKIITSKNPVSVIREEKAFNKIKKRKGYIRAEQLNDWSLCVATSFWIGNQNDDMHGYTNQDFLFLIIFTGLRREEAESLEWKNIDLKYGTIKIIDPKNHEDLLLPIGDTLWYLLTQRKKRAGDNKYVFPDKSGKSHIVDRRKARELVTDMSGIEFTYHDLRRTFGTIANSLAIGSYTIKRLINHTTDDDDTDVTGGYVQVTFEDLRNAMNLIEDKILSDKVRYIIKNRLYINKGKPRNASQDWQDHNNNLLKEYLE